MARPRKSYALWVCGVIFRTLIGAVILSIVLVLLWRIYFSGKLPDSMDALSPNAALAEAYATHGDELRLYTQTQSSITKGEDNYGYFAVPRFIFIPEANQLQVVFRYNNSTLKAVAEDLQLAEVPARGVEIFDVSLILRSDLTPETTEDNTDDSPNVGSERLHPTSVSVDTTSLYTYFLYTFDNVTVAEETLVIYLDVYYGDAPDYTTRSLGQLRLYHHEADCIEKDLTRAEKKALAAYKK